ncbi:MAG: DUF3822 family protein [Bacteroidetes bacterium]|nr:DUF3822 family protein [Bacteroidota bacterium]
MGALIHDIVEKGFDASKTKTYELSILVGMGSFDYMVHDAQQRVLLWRSRALSASNEEEYGKAVEQDRVLRQPFRNIRVGWSSTKQTLVPNRLYNPAEQAVYLEQSVDIDAEEKTRAEEVPAMGMHHIYAVKEPDLKALQSHFPGSRHFHLGTALLHEQQRLMANMDTACVFIHLRGPHLWVSAFDKSILRFFNSFSYKSTKDFVYFVLLGFDEAGLKPSGVPTLLSGAIVENSEIYQQLSRYLPDMAFAPRSAYYRFDGLLKQQPAHFYFDLLSLSNL